MVIDDAGGTLFMQIRMPSKPLEKKWENVKLQTGWALGWRSVDQLRLSGVCKAKSPGAALAAPNLKLGLHRHLLYLLHSKPTVY